MKIKKETYSTDSLGGINSISSTEYTIEGRFEEISGDKLKYAGHGNSYTGIARFFFRSDYTDFEVEVGDIIIDDDSREWRITEVNIRNAGSRSAFGVAMLSKIGEEK